MGIFHKTDVFLIGLIIALRLQSYLISPATHLGVPVAPTIRA